MSTDPKNIDGEAVVVVQEDSIVPPDQVAKVLMDAGMEAANVPSILQILFKSLTDEGWAEKLVQEISSGQREVVVSMSEEAKRALNLLAKTKPFSFVRRDPSLRSGIAGGDRVLVIGGGESDTIRRHQIAELLSRRSVEVPQILRSPDVIDAMGLEEIQIHPAPRGKNLRSGTAAATAFGMAAAFGVPIPKMFQRPDGYPTGGLPCPRDPTHPKTFRKYCEICNARIRKNR